jgi:hypothetical protein
MKPTKVTPLQNNRNHNNVCRWHEKHPQPWTWAQKRARRLEKGWNWKLLDAKWEKTKAHTRGACRLRCTNGKRLGSPKTFFVFRCVPKIITIVYL